MKQNLINDWINQGIKNRFESKKWKRVCMCVGVIKVKRVTCTKIDGVKRLTTLVN